MTLPLLAVGAVGVVGVATHWCGADVAEMLALWSKGDTDGARRVNARLLESWAFETGDESPNPLPAKAMLRHIGLRVGHCRLPMGPEPEWLPERARTVLANLQASRA